VLANNSVPTTSAAAQARMIFDFMTDPPFYSFIDHPSNCGYNRLAG
jgi:hypothetical protein